MTTVRDGRGVERASAAAAPLMAIAALTLAAASLLHFGLSVPLGAAVLEDPYPGAAIPEAVIAAVLAAGTVGALTGGAGRRAAEGAAVFALLGVAFGLAVTLREARPGDVAYHLSLLCLLVATGGLLFARPRGRTS
jgi:hypothetical protein